jgi:hypothetical protein
MGTHVVTWLNSVDVPMFVSRNQLKKRKSLPTAINDWCLDSGGFTEIGNYGLWRTTVEEYESEVLRLMSIGKMQWCAPQDWMCEPLMLLKTGLTVQEHQQRTVENFLELRSRRLPVIPVLQGWQIDDYVRCVEMYARAGVDLTSEATVGLGSVCRRQATNEIFEITRELAGYGLRLHGFGVKMSGLSKYGQFLVSADSMAWSFGGRMSPDKSCEKNNCANCLHYALSWREKVLARIAMCEPIFQDRLDFEECVMADG